MNEPELTTNSEWSAYSAIYRKLAYIIKIWIQVQVIVLQAQWSRAMSTTDMEAAATVPATAIVVLIAEAAAFEGTQ